MVCAFGMLSEERAPSSVIVPEPGVLPSPGERGPSSAFSPDPESSPLPHAGVETGWRWGVGVVEGFWKTRDNGGKAAWLFIGVLSRVYWISDVITDDELAVLIICACSSRNLLIKHHLKCMSECSFPSCTLCMPMLACVPWISDKNLLTASKTYIKSTQNVFWGPLHFFGTEHFSTLSML